MNQIFIASGLSTVKSWISRFGTSCGKSTKRGQPMNLQTTDALQPETNFECWLRRGILLLVVLSSALAMSPDIADPDLWGHVQYGFDVLDTGAIAETTTYSYTAEGFRWINHENLSEIVMALLVNGFGPSGLLLGKFLLSLAVILAIFWFNLKQGTSLLATSMVTLLVAWNLGYHWSFRPQLASFVFFACLVLLLQHSFAGWRDRWHITWLTPLTFSRGEKPKVSVSDRIYRRSLWLAPLIMVAWTNSHGGFVAGLCIMLVYLACRAVEASCAWGNCGMARVRSLAVMATAVVLATLINPYSYRLPMWLIESLGSPRPEIADWSSEQLYGLIGLKFWALVIIAVGALGGSRRSLDFTQTVVLLLTLWQALAHFRHVPFFAIICGFWMGPHLNSVLLRLQGGVSTSTESIRMAKPAARFATGAVVLVILGAISLQLHNRLSRLKVDRNVFPVDAFQYIADQGLGGHIVVTYDWAQYAIAAFCAADPSNPNPARVAFDGRFRTCYPQQIVDMHFDFLYGHATGIARHRSPASPPCDPARVLQYGEPDLVILRRKGEQTEKHMYQQAKDWVLLYQDALAQVWGRRQKFDNPDSPEYRSPDRRNISNRVPVGYADWPALPKNNRWWTECEKQNMKVAQAGH
jgi:hypothetical protein